MLGFERVEHAVLVISFLALGWTGFALKYPDQWWAAPLLIWEDRWPVRSWIHRLAAVAFHRCLRGARGLSGGQPRLRKHWMELWPRVRDLREAIENMTVQPRAAGSVRPYRSGSQLRRKGRILGGGVGRRSHGADLE
jgi:hypothetical protein